MIIGVVIPTRLQRPELLAQCLKMLDRQTVQPDHIVVVDYPATSDKPDIMQRYRKGYNSLKDICDLVFFIEEDDYYSDNYIETVTDNYNGESLIGFNSTLYYHIISQKYEHFSTPSHSSMFCTAMKGGLTFPEKDTVKADILLWKTFDGKLLSIPSGCIGIKHGQGLIVSRGHDMKLGSQDNDFQYLQELTGDCSFYRTMAKQIQTRVIGFYHVCMINNYEDVVKEQMQMLVKSGLYDRADVIFAGAVGSNVSKLEEIFSPYRKVKLLSYSPILSEYEFITLKLIHQKSLTEKPFYGFYLHTKGVSHPGHPAGKHWRDYMNYYLINRWRDNFKKLSDGYDTCGVKYLNSGWPPHYSGNFFWFRSEYSKKLKPVDSIDKKDRFQAEFWICSAGSKPANLCDKFVDYKTTGDFIP